MATRHTAITNIGEYRDRRSQFHSHTGASETTSAVEHGGMRKPAESVTTPIDVPFDVETAQTRLRSDRPLVSQAELYPVRQAFSPEHITALRLLTIAIGRCRRASEAMAQNEFLVADIEIQKIQVLLPELFCCRTLGDGFGSTINSLISALDGLGGETPKMDQIRTLSRVFEVLRQKPFLSADEADEHIDLLEAAGLSTYPAELMEFLSSV